MEEEDEDVPGSMFGSIAEKLRRVSHRLSVMIPKALRFSMMGPSVTSAPVPVGQRVCLRVRPAQLARPGANASKATAAANSNVEEQLLVVTVSSSTELVLDRPAIDRQNMQAKGPNYGVESYTYSFSRVFSEGTLQACYFEDTAGPMVADLLTFRHKTYVVMAYGSSGSGKTFTIEGTSEEPGLIPRAIQKIFQDLSPQLCVHSSYYEVYQEGVYDLMVTAAPLQRKRVQLKVREDGQGQVSVQGLSQVQCKSSQEALDMYRKASKLRQQASTGLNSCSSRSHAIFTVVLSRGSGKEAQCSKLHFVDLAGSERAARTCNAPERLRESSSINSSLSTLTRCLQALRANSTAANSANIRPVPYRESKITHLFKDILHGEGCLTLLVCVSPLAADYEETHHVLRYAALASKIKVAPLPPIKSLAALCPINDQRISLEDHTEETSIMQEQIDSLQLKLRAMEAQVLAHNEMLNAAEVSIRTEVVQELQSMVSEIRLEYDDQLLELQESLKAKDLELAELRAQLHQQVQPALLSVAADADVEKPVSPPHPVSPPLKRSLEAEDDEAPVHGSDGSPIAARTRRPQKRRKAK